MALPIFIVDAFTERPFEGNPAAVCLLDSDRESPWMHLVAREMNLSETAFLLERTDGWSLRWFTPTVEVDLCGHATLASAHVLWEIGRCALDRPTVFHTRSGVLICFCEGERITMDFPAVRPESAEAPPGLLEALGVEAMYVGCNRMDYLVRVDSESVVRRLQPDMSLLATVEARGAIVTACADAAQYDFVSRCFYPASGVPEDPVTGSAHCALGPFWQGILGKDTLVGFQASARGGIVRVAVNGDRVRLTGRAMTAVRGELLVG